MRLGSFKLLSPGGGGRKPISQSRKIALVLVACVGAAVWAKPLGMLLWARIRILTNIPKTAIAEPTLAEAPKPVVPPDLDPQLPSLASELRDPFRVDTSVFPPPTIKAATPPGGEKPTTGSGGGNRGTESTNPAAAEADGVRIAAESLRVQSAGAGLSVAVIENQAVRVGSTVTAAAGIAFTLVRVIDGGVVVAHAGREFEVMMPAQFGSAAPKVQDKKGGSKP